MNQRTVIRYSNCFKLQVVEELENGRFSSISAAQEHYGITGSETIQGWLRKYGRNHLRAKVVRVEKPDEADQIRQLKKQIKQLREALGQTQAEKVLGESFLEIACERLGMEAEEFKKKADMMQFTERKKKHQQQ
jgi:transposase-like protein